MVLSHRVGFGFGHHALHSIKFGRTDNCPAVLKRLLLLPLTFPLMNHFPVPVAVACSFSCCFLAEQLLDLAAPWLGKFFGPAFIFILSIRQVLDAMPGWIHLYLIALAGRLSAAWMGSVNDMNFTDRYA